MLDLSDRDSTMSNRTSCCI